MAVADLQEGKNICFRRLRFAHDPQGGRYTPGNGPQHAGAAPGHALPNLSTGDAVSMVEFTHCGSPFSRGSPSSFGSVALQLDFPNADFIPGWYRNRRDFVTGVGEVVRSLRARRGGDRIALFFAALHLVRFWHKADIPTRSANGRFRG